MDSSSKQLLDLLDLELLESLLKNSSSINTNHPFLVFLDSLKIRKGNNKVELSLLLKLYKASGGIMKGITEARIVKLCSHLMDPATKIFNINISDKQIKSKLNTLIPKKDYYISAVIKKKFETFVRDNAKQLEGIEFVKAYVLYTKYVKKKKLLNPFSEQLFIQLCKLYFSN